MKFIKTSLNDAYIVEIESIEDKRGFFARGWDSDEFKQVGLCEHIEHCNISFNKQKGTLRGMHYQASPFEEVKMIRCIQGSIFDAIIDLRPASSTFKKWYGVTLSATNHKMLYVPENFAHGFITLDDNVEVFYMVSQKYSKEHERGIRWNDPEFNISWPIEPTIISDKDTSWKLYT